MLEPLDLSRRGKSQHLRRGGCEKKTKTYLASVVGVGKGDRGGGATKENKGTESAAAAE